MKRCMLDTNAVRALLERQQQKLKRSTSQPSSWNTTKEPTEVWDQGLGMDCSVKYQPGQVLQVMALPGRIALVPLRRVSELRGFLKGPNTFERERDR